MGRLLSPAAVAERLGISAEVVRRAVRDGRIDGQRVSRRRIGIPEEAVVRYLADLAAREAVTAVAAEGAASPTP